MIKYSIVRFYVLVVEIAFPSSEIHLGGTGLLSVRGRGKLGQLMLATLWCMWRKRNEHTFKDVEVVVHGLKMSCYFVALQYFINIELSSAKSSRLNSWVCTLRESKLFFLHAHALTHKKCKRK